MVVDAAFDRETFIIYRGRASIRRFRRLLQGHLERHGWSSARRDSGGRLAAQNRRTTVAEDLACRSCRPSRVCPTMRPFRPASFDSHPTIVPLTRNPVPLQARPVPHTEVPRRLFDHSWWLPTPVRSVCCTHARCARTRPAGCAVARSVKAGVAAGQACGVVRNSDPGRPGTAD